MQILPQSFCTSDKTGLRLRCSIRIFVFRNDKHYHCPGNADSGIIVLGLEDMRAMAFARGGACLSTECVSGSTRMRWRCAEGHEFYRTPNEIRRPANGARKPAWCPVCAKAESAKAKRAKVKRAKPKRAIVRGVLPSASDAVAMPCDICPFRDDSLER